jgi:hypothetical protein
MRKAYIFVYDAKTGTREQVQAAIDKMPEILNWRRDTIPNMFYIISNESAQTLADLIKEAFPQACAFLIIEASENRQGYLTKKSWEMLGEKPLPS